MTGDYVPGVLRARLREFLLARAPQMRPLNLREAHEATRVATPGRRCNDAPGSDVLHDSHED